MKYLLLDSNWQFKLRDAAHSLADDFASSAGWLPASVPGTVQQDLLAAGRIPDPFDGLNENLVQWVGECDWLYRCIFKLPADFEEAKTVTLCCDGLDTFVTVWLNGVQVLASDNMFVPLRVHVRSALRRGREREAQYGCRLTDKLALTQLWG